MKTALVILGAVIVQTYGGKLSSKSMTAPVEINPGSTSTCNNIDYTCGEQITICGSGGPYGTCFCAGDIDGHTQCIQDTSCENLVRCSDGGECGGGLVCVSGQTCCGIPNCVPLCNGSMSTTTTSMPTTTSGNTCSGSSWQCGGMVTICGDLGPYDECFCGDDVEGNADCFIDEACSTQTQCTQNSNCPGGQACVTGTCCEFSLCLPYCTNGSTTTPAPNTPAPTSSNVCSSAEWTCGGNVVQCGDQGPFGICFCNEDENGNHYCMIDDYCSDMAACSSNSQCTNGEICAPSCCGAGNCFTICSGEEEIDPVSRLLPISAFHSPTEQEKFCAETYVRCRERCSGKFGRCTAKHGECTPDAVECLAECKSKRETCDKMRV